MDRYNTSENRFSGANLTTPVAESTSLHINERNSPMQFHWGGSQTSKINRFKSNEDLSYKSGKNFEAESTDYRSIGSRFNTSRIDPRIYADVQSKGLASRIVKYHEKGNRFNRSLSVNSLYSKPGQFPIVYLKKTEIPHGSMKPNVSMTRIPPPEKSIFYGNTLPSILRNSAITMQKSDEVLSSENRPILHPPQTKNELAPTRSVLEVLKEISRKRINSEHLSPKDDVKKYCSRTVDNLANSTTSSQQHKRQREHLNSPNFTQHLSSQHSPEQLPKKRLCSYNNDITSSLSSSQTHLNKRKFHECRNNNESAPQATSPEQKRQATITNKRLVQQSSITANLSTKSTLSDDTQKNDHSKIRASTVDNHIAKEQLTQYGDKMPRPEEITHASSVNKPKLTLFNKNYNECKEIFETKESMDTKSPTVNGEFSAIPFIKPKKDISIFGSKNPIILRTQKSKLALMLSGLRGDLYNDEDQLAPNQLEKKVSEENKTNALSAETSNEKSTANYCITSSDKPTETLAQVKSFISDICAVEPVETAQVAITTTTSAISYPVCNSYIISDKAQTSTNTTNATAVVAQAQVAKESAPLSGIKTTSQNMASSPLINFSPSSKNPINKELPSAATVSSSGASNNQLQFPSPIPTTTATSTIGLPNNSNVHSSIAAMNSNTFKSPPILAFGSSNSFPSTTAFKSEAAMPNKNLLNSSNPPKPFAFGSAPLAPSSSDVEVKTPGNNIIEANSKTSDAAVLPKPFNSGSLSTNTPVSKSSTASSTQNAFNFGTKSSDKPFALAAPFSISSTTNQCATQAPTNFAFGAAATSANSASAVPSSSTDTVSKFTFGNVSSQNKPINSNVANQSAIVFGQIISSTNPQTTVDGSSKKEAVISAPFTFNSAVNSSSPASKSGGFAFGNSSLSSNKEHNQQTTNNVSSFTNVISSVAKPSFSFGNANPVAATAPAKPIFGSPSAIAIASTPPSSESGNTFGSLASAAGNSQNKTFTFGSVNNSSDQKNSVNLKSGGGGFFFNPDNAQATTFGKPVTTTASAQASSTFSFGSAIANNAAANSPKPFPSSAPATNLFGTSSLPNTSAASKPFNFGASPTVAAPAAPAANGNIFLPQSQNASPGLADRPFRRATRRLQKP